MYEQITTALSRAGAHGRPCGLIADTAARFKSNILLIRNGEIVNAKSIMGLVALCISYRDSITIRADGVDEKEAVKALVQVFDDKFHED